MVCPRTQIAPEKNRYFLVEIKFEYICVVSSSNIQLSESLAPVSAGA